MKTFIMEFLVLTSIIYACFSEENDLSHEDKCEEERSVSGFRFYTCLEEMKETPDELMRQFNITIYSNLTEASLQDWTKRTCEFGQKSLNCATNAYDLVVPQCKNVEDFQRFGIYINMAKEGIDYFCKNDAQHLKDIGENDGYRFLFYTDHFQTCKTMMSKEKMSLQKPGEFEMNPNFCTSFDETKKCFVDALKQSKNEKMKIMADEVFTNVKAVIPCDTTQ